MTQEEKINYMRIASGICGFGFKMKDLDLLVSLYELTMKKQGKATINDVVEVEFAVKEREAEREVNNKNEKL